MHDSVERAIAVILRRYEEPLSLAELSAEALLSPFHLSRIFRAATGVSPGQYLAAVRMFEAKRLLLTRPYTVAEISSMVGYSSVSTFTTRFTRVVGAPPTKYRLVPRESLLGISADLRMLPARTAIGRCAQPGVGRGRPGAVSGPVRLPPGVAVSNIFVGVFDSRVPQQGPVACRLLVPPLWYFRVDDVPAGSWVVLAMAEQRADEDRGPDGGVLVGASGPVEVRPGGTSPVALPLRRPRPTDPPLLLSLAWPRAA